MRKACHLLCAVTTIIIISFSVTHAQRNFRRGGNKDVTDTAGCVLQGGGFRFAGTWSRTMVAQSGAPCGGTFMAGGGATFKRLYLIAGPHHGRVVLQEGGHYHYMSAAGYHGADSFTLRVCGIGGGGRQGCGNLQYSVTVQ